jgi:hypothetical protein
MNRQAGPSIVLSVLIVGFFAVVLFPGDTTRPTASTPRNPIAGPIVSGQPTAKPAPPTARRSEQRVESSPDSLARSTAAAQPVAGGSRGRVLSEDIAVTAKSTQATRAAVDSTRRTQSVSERPVGTSPPMGRTEPQSTQQTATTRPVQPAGQTIRRTSKESIRPDPHTWSLIHPEVSAERSGTDHSALRK